MRSKGALTAASAGVATALFASPLWLGVSLMPLALVATAAGGVCGLNMVYTAVKARSTRKSIKETPVRTAPISNTLTNLLRENTATVRTTSFDDAEPDEQEV